jgi:hypothetical protein
MDLLYAIRDVGVVVPAADDAGDRRARAELAREIERATRADTSTGRARVLTRRRSVTRDPHGSRRAIAIAAAGVLVVCSSVAVATVVVDPSSTVSVASPAQLFADNPADWNQDNPPNSGTHVVAASVQELGTVSVPGVGALQYWGAKTIDGRWCAAFRAPDGTWVNATRGRAGLQPNYSSGGDVPGCGVWPTQAPAPDSTTPVAPGKFGFNFQGGGFYYSEDTVSPLPDAQSTTSWVVYGIVDDPGSATTVVDATSGASTPILAHGTFALVLAPNHAWPLRLEAVDASGNVISRAYPSGGGYPLAPAQKAYREQRMRLAQGEERPARAARSEGAHSARVPARRRPT